MIRSFLARTSGAADLRAWTEQRLKELARTISEKADRARRDASREAATLIEPVRHEARRGSERLDSLKEHLKQTDVRRQERARLTEQRLDATELAAAAREQEIVRLRQQVATLEAWAEGSDRTAAYFGDVMAACVSMHEYAGQVRDRIRAAALEREPLAHALIDKVLPDALYDLLLATIPPPACFEALDYTKADFRPFGGPPAPMVSRLLWQAFDRELVDGAMKDALLCLFAPVLRDHYARILGDEGAAEAAAAPMSARGRLMRRTPGYHLEPHLDPKRVLITGILYFARPQDSEDYGTSLFRIDREFNASYMKTFYPREHGLECTLAKTVKFRRNRLFAFINSGAAHGATIPADATQADRYAFQFYIKPHGPTLQRLIRNAPADRREQWGHLGAADSPEDDD